MRYRDAFPSKFLRADDLGASRPIVQIEAVRLERIGDDQRLIVRFAGKGKALPLNRTNATAIAEIAGTDDTDRWPGTLVRLFTTPVLFQGRTVQALRIGPVDASRPPVPAARPAAAAPPPAVDPWDTPLEPPAPPPRAPAPSSREPGEDLDDIPF